MLRPIRFLKSRKFNQFKIAAMMVMLGLSLPGTLASAASHDPRLRWQSLETPHFSIHFHQGEETLAMKAAGIAEDVHSRLVPVLQWTPREKTQVVLTDETDEANGLATPIFYNTMILNMAPPHDASFDVYEDWLRELITHEYTHILHLDTVRGPWRSAQAFFGRLPISFLNLFQPNWMIEGLATLEETRETTGGRGRSAFFDMMLRSATLEGRLNTLDQMTGFQTTWPGRTISYLYGVSFYQFIQARFGDQMPTALSQYNAQRFLPMFFVDGTARRVLGEGYVTVYQEWKKSLESKYAGQKTAIEKMPLVEGTPITRRGYQTRQAAYAPHSHELLYMENNEDEYPSLRVVHDDGRGDRRLVAKNINGTVSWSPDGRKILFAYLELHRNVNVFGDLALYDVASGKCRRLTQGLRARDATWFTHDPDKILFLRNEPGTSQLAVYELSSGRVTPFGPREPDWVFDGPSWSPDGQRLAVSVWKPGGRREIMLIRADGSFEQSLTTAHENAFSPVWSPDSRTVYYSSDRSGVYNIYACDLSSPVIRQVTNVLSGAFEPAISPDGKALVYTGYTSRGFDLYRMALTPGYDSPSPSGEKPASGQAHPKKGEGDQDVTVSSHPYHPLPTLAPRFWAPLLVLTAGEDALRRHNYFAQWGGGQNHIVSYLYDRWFPSFGVAHSQVNRQRQWEASVVLPWQRLRYRHQLFLGYSRSGFTREEQTDLQGDLSPDFQSRLGLVFGGWAFTNAKMYGFSIAPEEGRRIEAIRLEARRSLGSDHARSTTLLHWSEFRRVPFTRHHALALSLGQGFSTEQEFSQEALSLADRLTPLTARGARGQRSARLIDPLQYRWMATSTRVGSTFFDRKLTQTEAVYSFPIAYIEHGPGTGFFFFDRLWGAGFYRLNHLWNHPFRISDEASIAGGRLGLELGISYIVKPALILEISRRTDRAGAWQTGFGIGASF